MTKNNDSTASAKKDVEDIKKEVEALVKTLSDLKGKSGDVMSEQLDHLAETISGLKHSAEEKKQEVIDDITASTRKHPLRNLGYAFGAGVLLSLVLR